MNHVDKALRIKIPAILHGTDKDEASHSAVGPNIFESRTALDVLISGKGIIGSSSLIKSIALTSIDRQISCSDEHGFRKHHPWQPQC